MLHPTIEFELSRARAADQHRQAARSRMAREAGRARRDRRQRRRPVLGHAATAMAGRLLPAGHPHP